MASLRLLPSVLALLTLLTLAACAGGGEEAPSPDSTLGPSPSVLQAQPEPVQPLSEEVSEPEDGVIEVRIEGARFVPNNLSMKAGESITLRAANADSQPHNLRIAGPDGQYETEDDAISQPAVIGGGQTGELIFAPAVPGTYSFRCDFHPGSMGGQIAVGG